MSLHELHPLYELNLDFWKDSSCDLFPGFRHKPGFESASAGILFSRSDLNDLVQFLEGRGFLWTSVVNCGGRNMVGTLLWVGLDLLPWTNHALCWCMTRLNNEALKKFTSCNEICISFWISCVKSGGVGLGLDLGPEEAAGYLFKLAKTTNGREAEGVKSVKKTETTP